MKIWESYEQVATYLLNQFAEHFGLSHVEGKQKIKGLHSKTDWEIDAKGVRKGNEGIIIVEARRYTKSRLSQEQLGGLAFRISDIGAKGGILVSPLGLQEGAAKIAESANIINVQLAPNSTNLEYIMRFLNKIMVGVHDTVKVTESVVVVLKKSA